MQNFSPSRASLTHYGIVQHSTGIVSDRVNRKTSCVLCTFYSVLVLLIQRCFVRISVVKDRRNAADGRINIVENRMNVVEDRMNAVEDGMSI